MLFNPPEMAIINIPVENIRPSPQQVRISSEEDKRIDELAKSMKEVSILQPLIVEVVEEGVYQVLCGHRRLLAAKKQGMEKVPCIIRHEKISESEGILMMLIENIHRKNLSPIELADGYARLQEKGVCQVVIAGRVGKSESHVSQALEPRPASRRTHCRVATDCGVSTTAGPYRCTQRASPASRALIHKLKHLPACRRTHYRVATDCGVSTIAGPYRCA